MAGRGPAPDPQRIRSNDPARGDWTPSPDRGWQHPLPPPPAGLMASSAEVWETWFRSWWAANWNPDDLPALRYLIRLWDRVHRGDLKHAGELRQLMDSYGITPKGQQDRRWVRPVQRTSSFSSRMDANRAAAGLGPYRPPDDRPSVRERMRAAEVDGMRPACSRFEQLIGTQPSRRDPRLDPLE